MRRLSLMFGIVIALAAAQPDARFHVVKDWPKLPPGMKLEPVTGVALDPAGRVWIVHRSKERPLLCFDPQSGELLDSWGAGLFSSPHGLTLDAAGNFWVTDIDTHQVFQFGPDKKLRLALGERGVPGADASHFNKPTTVAVAPNGDFYVADGYGNARIVKFSKAGKFLKAWGEKGDQPGQFDTPHGIAVDPQGRVYVADRGNARIQVFDGDGKLLHVWKTARLGRPWGLDLGPDGYLYVVDGGNATREPTERNRAFRLDLNGNVWDEWGSFGREPGQFFWAHDVAVGRDGAVYISEVDLGSRVQKFLRR